MAEQVSSAKLSKPRTANVRLPVCFRNVLCANEILFVLSDKQYKDLTVRGTACSVRSNKTFCVWSPLSRMGMKSGVKTEECQVALSVCCCFVHICRILSVNDRENQQLIKTHKLTVHMDSFFLILSDLMRPWSFNPWRHNHFFNVYLHPLSCWARSQVLARRADSSTADEQTLNQSAVLFDSPIEWDLYQASTI